MKEFGLADKSCKRCGRSLASDQIKKRTDLCSPCQRSKMNEVIADLGKTEFVKKSDNSQPLSLPGEYQIEWVRGEYEFVPAEKIDFVQVRDLFCVDAPEVSHFQKYIKHVFGLKKPSDSVLIKILKDWFSLGAIKAKPGAKIEIYRPMEHDLRTAFDDVDGLDIDSILAFANSWGLLGFFLDSDDLMTLYKNTSRELSLLIEPVAFFAQQILAFHHYSRIYTAFRDKDVFELRELWKPYAQRLNLKLNDNEGILSYTQFQIWWVLERRIEDVRLVLQGKLPFQRGYRIPRLIDAIWLQRHLDLTHPDRTLRRCANEKCNRQSFVAEGKRIYHDTTCENAQTQRDDRAVRTFAKSKGLRYEKLSKKKRKELRTEFKKLKQKERGKNERPSP